MATDNVASKYTDGSKNFRKQYTKTWNELRGNANVKIVQDTLVKFRNTDKHEEVAEACKTLKETREVIMSKLNRLTSIQEDWTEYICKVSADKKEEEQTTQDQYFEETDNEGRKKEFDDVKDHYSNLLLY